MALLSQEQREEIRRLKSEGHSLSEIQGFIGGKANGRTNMSTIGKQQAFKAKKSEQEEARSVLARVMSDIGSDLVEGVKGIGQQFKEGGETIVEQVDGTAQAEGVSAPARGARIASQVPGTIAGAVGETALTAGKLFTTDDFEKKVAEKLGRIGENVSNTPAFQKSVETFNNMNPNTQSLLMSTLDTVDGAGTIFGLGATKSFIGRTTDLNRHSRDILRKRQQRMQTQEAEAPEVTPTRAEAPEVTPTRAEAPEVETLDVDPEQATLFDETMETVNQAIQRDPGLAPDTTTLTLKEKMVGITPDVKKRLSGNPSLLNEYIETALARNVSDEAVTPYGFGAARAQEAVQRMEEAVNDVGSDIGKFRRDVGSKTVLDDAALSSIEETFEKQLARLNLNVVTRKVDGVERTTIERIPGTISKTEGNDIGALKELYDEMQVMKENPNLINAFDYRALVDNKINFKKRDNQVSGAVQPFAKALRSTIADVAGKAAGRTHKNDIDAYSKAIDTLDNLRSYTDRKTGGVYLLRLIMSGRGDEAKEVVKQVKKYTDMDLQDDATMMTVVTDMLGNNNQKNLFRQEIGKAASDAAALARGDAPGIIMSIVGRGAEKFADPESVLRELAGQKSEGVIDRFNRAADEGKFGKPRMGLATEDVSSGSFAGLTGLSTRLIEQFKGLPNEVKPAQFDNVINASKKKGIKPADEQIVRSSMVVENGKVNLTKTAEAVQEKVLPLTASNRGRADGDLSTDYEGVVLPDDVRGDVGEYFERVYESPVETSAGRQHFSDSENYFAHTRVEDMADADTRRVIEMQSDLFQAGKLEKEFVTQEDNINYNNPTVAKLSKEYDELKEKGATQKQLSDKFDEIKKADDIARTEENAKLSTLQPYKNTWFERIIREEVSDAAKDGKSKLQFPTGKTAAMVEGHIGNGVPEDIEVGNFFEHQGREWRAAEDMGDSIRAYPQDEGTPFTIPDVADDIKNSILEFEDAGDIQFELNKLGAETQLRNALEKQGITEKYTLNSEVFVGKPFSEIKNDHPDIDMNQLVDDIVEDLDIDRDQAIEWLEEESDSDFIPNTNNDFEIIRFDNPEMSELIPKNDSAGDPTESPVYNFYEKSLPKYLKKRYDAKRVTDEEGMEWWEVDIDPEEAKKPVEALGIVPPAAAAAGPAATAMQEEE